MIRTHRRCLFQILLTLLSLACGDSLAQEKLKIAYSSIDAPNANWYIAEDKHLYQKYGLDPELIFISSSTTNVSALVAGSIKVGNVSGGAFANAAVGGADIVCVGSFINTLPYELVVNESIKSPQALKGKSIGISRVGSSSDVAARVFLKALGLEPDKDVAILQVGGSPERAAAFRTGRIAGFASPPGTAQLAKGMPYRILVSMSDLPTRYPFPYVCVTTTRSYLAANRSVLKRIMMALIDATHFFKTQKEESKRIFAKYSRQNNEAYLEAGYEAISKLFEKVPLVTREGMEIQIKDALTLARKAGPTVRTSDVIDDSIVLELEKEGFIDRIYK
ncbi:MAG TPA: ABC transporter substrate-binding protein [Candidatus Binatia bacterium]|jgi:NitT/TauT family transport system substrate-binding protein